MCWKTLTCAKASRHFPTATIPQLYVKGEFVGGADIVKEMFEQEELVPFLTQHGVALERLE